MQAEILARGPIVCSMQTADDANPLGAWHCYEGGVYRTNSTFRSTNHVVSLLRNTPRTPGESPYLAHMHCLSWYTMIRRETFKYDAYSAE